MVDKRGYIYNIIIVILIVLVSIPIWFSKKNSQAYLIANSFDNMDIYIASEGFSYDRDEEHIIKNNNIYLRNQNSFTKEYKLIMIIENKYDLLDKDNYILLNNKKYYLNELKYEIKDNYLLIELDNNSIDGYTNYKYEFSFYYSNYNISNLYLDFQIK